MKELTNEIKEQIKEVIYEFFAEECEVEVDEISEETNIVDDLDGDSLMFVELVQVLSKKFELNIKLQNIGKYLLKNQPQTISGVIEVSNLIYQYEDDIVNLGN